MKTRNEIIEILKNYQEKKITHQKMCESLDNLYMGIANRLEKQLFIEDIFLSHLIPWITTIPEQAYSDAELIKMVDSFERTNSISFRSFVRISLNMLTDDETKILRIAQSIADETESAEHIKESFRMNSQDRISFNNICDKYAKQRMEFYSFITVPEWITYQLIYIMKILQMKSLGHLLNSRDITATEITDKLKRYTLLLSGKEPIYGVTNGYSFSAI